jgi:hypothetical protein
MARALPDMPGAAAGPEVLAKIRHGTPLTRADIGMPALPAAGGAFVKVVDASGELAAVIEPGGADEGWKYAGVFMGPGR